MFKHLLVVILFVPLAAFAQDKFIKINLYDFPIIKVVDGDTYQIKVDFLPPELGSKLKLRLKGVDTPEIGSHAHCDAERLEGERVKQKVEEIIKSAEKTRVLIHKWDGFGRILGDVIIYQKDQAPQSLINIVREENLAMKWNPKQKFKALCGIGV